ncbi:MAG TPA: response regulator [Bacteroidota bacterium]|nr:response regulator [Bacteroidota bacterium]
MNEYRYPRILNVDDNDAGRYSVTRILQHAGFQVLEAANGREALRLADEGPDLILLDVKLPDISGLEVCRRIRANERTASIPVVHLSAAYVGNDDLASAIEQGADGYLTHPIDAKVLVATINGFLRLKTAEQRLRESEERFRSLYENSTIGLYRITTDGELVLVNTALMKMLGYASSDELTGGNFVKMGIVSPTERKTFIERLDANGEVKDFESAWTRNDGSIVYVSESARTVRDAADRTLFYDGTVNDITERKAIDELLRDVQRREAIGVMSSGIAHDFNNLLAAMMGNVSLAQMQLPDTHPVQKFLGHAIVAMETAAELVQQILAYSGKGKYDNRTIDLREEIEEHMSLFRISMPKNVRLATRLASDPVYVTADPGQIKQIIMNLVMNGGEAIGPKPGEVSVTLAAVTLGSEELATYAKFTNTALNEGRYARLDVHDNGIGISQDGMHRIFDPFYSTKFIGRGLGLAAVLGIIRRHKGGI